MQPRIPHVTNVSSVSVLVGEGLYNQNLAPFWTTMGGEIGYCVKWLKPVLTDLTNYSVGITIEYRKD